MNIDAQELVQILNNEKIQLQGAAHLLRFAPIAANTRIANDLAYVRELIMDMNCQYIMKTFDFLVLHWKLLVM